MNLSVKSLGQLLIMAVALFFFSCEEETSLLGFKNPNQKFSVNYIEIPVESSVLLVDSLRTTNFLFTGETNRFLAGQYEDPQLGKVTSEIYTQYFTTTANTLPSTASFDSVTLQLAFDFYRYGSAIKTDQTVTVYEINEELPLSGGLRNFFNKSAIQVKPGSLGTKTFSIDPVAFDKYYSEAKDTTLVVRLKLDEEFGYKLFQSALKWRDFETTKDSTFVYLENFVKEFKGLAIKSDAGDQVIGFNPSSASSKLTLHFQTSGEDSLQLNLSFSSLIGFSKITSDKSSTELSGIPGYFQDYTPASGKRYVQSGTGVFTKLDFSPFIAFAESLPTNVMINEAKLEITDVDASAANYAPPTNLGLKILKPNNRTKIFSILSDQDAADIKAYSGSDNGTSIAYVGLDVENASRRAVFERDSSFYVVNDLNSPSILTYSSTDKKYTGYATMFFQKLLEKKDNKTQFKNLLIYPLAPSGAKSVNRVIFPKDKIKLKVKYTQLTEENPE